MFKKLKFEIEICFFQEGDTDEGTLLLKDEVVIQRFDIPFDLAFQYSMDELLRRKYSEFEYDDCEFLSVSFA